jgi:hypothetical protein
MTIDGEVVIGFWEESGSAARDIDSLYHKDERPVFQ